MKMPYRTDECPYKVGEWLSLRRDGIFTVMRVSAPVAFVVAFVVSFITINHFETALLVGFVAYTAVVLCCYAALNIGHHHVYGKWLWPW